MRSNSFLIGVAVLASIISGSRESVRAATPGSTAATNALSFDPFTLTSTAAPSALAVVPNSSSIVAPADQVQPRTSMAPVTVVVGLPDEIEVNQLTTGTTTVPVVVSLNQASTQTVTVQYYTADGSASHVYDYSSKTGTVTFNPGQTQQTVTVTIAQSNTHDKNNNEYFYFYLQNATNAYISSSGASYPRSTVWIQGTHATNVSIVGTTVPQGTSGTSTATVNVYLNNGGSQTVMVKVATDDGTAVQGKNYKSVSQTVTFTPGQTVQAVHITIYGIAGHVPTTNFQAYLSDAVNAYIEYSSFRATVTLTGH